MATDLPKFESPPVVETVLGVQFARANLTAAHAGWFWRNFLEGDWPIVTEAPRLEDAFERPERTWARPGIRVSEGTEWRLQLIRADQERMVQVQDSRFIYNWKKGEGSYPTYEVLLPEFKQRFAQFERFMKEASAGPLDLNQWEVVYVNHLPKGELWESAKDWRAIFPRFRPVTEYLELDTFGGTWSHLLPRAMGRLHIELRHSKTQEDTEVIRLRFVARGPINEAQSFEEGFELGHEAIVRSFVDMTSDAAHRHWGRVQ